MNDVKPEDMVDGRWYQAWGPISSTWLEPHLRGGSKTHWSSGYGWREVCPHGRPVQEDRFVDCVQCWPGWTLEWPTEPGLYLFYGDYTKVPGGEFKPQLKLCQANAVPNGVILVAGGHFLYKSEQAGAFRPFSADIPDLAALGLVVDGK